MQPAATVSLKEAVATGNVELPSSLKAETKASGIRRAPAKAPANDTWTSIGQGEYMEDFLSYFDDVPGYMTWSVTIEQSQQNPGWYRLQPYASGAVAELLGMTDKTYLYVNATNPDKVYFEDMDPIFNYFAVYPLVPESEMGAAIVEQYEGVEFQYGTLKDGIISFPVYSAVLKTPGGLALSSLNTGCQIALPGSELLDETLTFTNDLCSEGSVEVKFTMGADVKKVKYEVLKGLYYMTPQNANVVAQYGRDLTGNTIVVNSDEIGRYSILAVVVREDGTTAASQAGYFIDIKGGDKYWGKVGTTTFNEVFVSAAYPSIASEDLTVDVEECSSRPGFFRLVNPYADHSAKQFLENHGHNHYIYIDATDPAHVLLNESVTGLDLNYGIMTVQSYGDYYYSNSDMTFKQIEDEGIEFGTLEDGLIIFPTGSLIAFETGYTALSKDDCIIDFSELAGIDSAVKADTTVGEVEYFNLQGIKVVNPENGVYIRRQGGEAKKVFIR